MVVVVVLLLVAVVVGLGTHDPGKRQLRSRYTRAPTCCSPAL